MDAWSGKKSQVATLRVRNFLALKDVMTDLGVDVSETLRRVGFEPRLFSDPQTTVLWSDFDRLVTDVLRTTKCEDLGLRVGERQDATAMGLTGLVSIHSPSVRDALQTIVEGLKMSDAGGVVTFEVRGSAASLSSRRPASRTAITSPTAHWPSWRIRCASFAARAGGQAMSS